MASIVSRRFANSLSWTLNFTTRSRTIAFTFSSAERFPRRHQPPDRSSLPNTRLNHQHFSTQCRRQQANAASASGRVPAPSSATPNNATIPPSSSTSHEPPPPTARSVDVNPSEEPIRELSSGLSDMPAAALDSEQVDWTRSFHGLSSEPFSKEVSDVLLAPLKADDIEIKPDGIIYLPEIKYRRILTRAFGPGGWGLAPRGETIVTPKSVTREYALVVRGRLIAIARGEQDYFGPENIPTAVEGCKSNAMMRCCKDLGIASELWDPRFIRKFTAENTKEVWVENVSTKKRRKISIRKDDEVRAPYKEVKMG